MATLNDIASVAQDLYYQDYADRSDLFDIDDFKFHCAAIYAKMLNALYQKMRIENKKEMGYSSVDINAEWMITDTFDDVKFDDSKKQHYIELNHDVFSFDFDAFGNGLNRIKSGDRSKKIKKITNNESEFLDVIPTTSNIYYYREGKRKIIFTCDPGNPVYATYIPSVDGGADSCVIANTMVNDMIAETLKLMFGAKNGNVIDESNDGNSNSVLSENTNPALKKVQQQ